MGQISIGANTLRIKGRNGNRAQLKPTMDCRASLGGAIVLSEEGKVQKRVLLAFGYYEVNGNRMYQAVNVPQMSVFGIVSNSI